MTKKLSDLMRAGFAKTEHKAEIYLEVCGNTVCACPLGAAYYAVTNEANADIDGITICNQLSNIIGYDLGSTEVTAPEEYYQRTYGWTPERGMWPVNLESAIITLVDDLDWTREQVLAWLEGLGL